MIFTDESRAKGHADAISKPKSLGELVQAIQQAARDGRRITVQGAATGLAGGAVPRGGLLLSTRGMNQILGAEARDGRFFMRAQAGVTFEQIEECLRKPIQGQLYYLPQCPTEKSATPGGAFACDAMGINRLRGGRFSACVTGLTWVTPQGEVLRFGRGDTLLEMEAIGLLAGSEGRLGIAAELELELQPVPGASWGVFFFFADLTGARTFAEALPRDCLTACVYFDHASLDLLRISKPLPEDAREALYLELSGDDEAALEERLAALLTLFERCGGRGADTWAADSPPEIESLRTYCHAVTELVNSEIDKAPGTIKFDLDFQSDHVWEQIDIFREEAVEAGIAIYCFGHVLLGQAHVCIVPRTPEEKNMCEALMARWSAQVAGQGGHLAFENGIGKNKRQLVWRLLPPARRAHLARLEAFFDPMGTMQNNLLQ